MTKQTSFNSTPIMLQPPTMTSSSLTMDDHINNKYTTSEQDILANMYYVSSSTYDPSYTLQQDDDNDDDDIMMPVPQHLDSEQINYEFPLRSHLKALAYLDQLEEGYSFFDETSFTSLTNDSSSASSSSASFLSGYFDHHQQDDTTIPLEQINYSTFFSTLTDEKENGLDLTYHHHHHQHHMSTQQQQQQQQHHQHQSSFSLYRHGIQEDEYEERSASSLEKSNLVVDDNRLSPLQLPAQAAHLLQREQSYESTSTITKNALVAPQSFLATPAYRSNNVDPSAFVQPSNPIHAHSRLNSLESVDLPIITSETEPIQEQDSDDGSSLTSDDLYPPQRVVLIRLNKRNMPFNKQCSSPLTYLAIDEGYDDEDQDGGKLGGDCEIESASVFLPLDDDDEEDYSGDGDHYLASPPSTVVSDHGLLLATLQQQQQQWIQRIQQLEQQVNEERAMRQAFEKAMEDMTVLMDQQQRVLYDRLEQEINMRQTYEHKMQQTLAHVEPLECRLEKETTARIQLEETMVHVLDQLELLQSQHQQHTKDNTIQHNRMQKKLDNALDDITNLTTRITTLETSPASPATPATPASASASSRKNHTANSTVSSGHQASTSITSTTTAKPNTNMMKQQPARSNATSLNHAAIASGTTANPPRISSRTAVTASAASTTTNKPKTSIAPISASVSRRTKLPNNNRSTKTPTKTIKNGTGGGDPDSHSTSRRVIFHR